MGGPQTVGVRMIERGRGMASPLHRPHNVGARPCLARIRRREAPPTISEAMPRPYPATRSVAHHPEAMPRPPSSIRGHADPVSQVMNQHTQLNL